GGGLERGWIIHLCGEDDVRLRVERAAHQLQHGRVDARLLYCRRGGAERSRGRAGRRLCGCRRDKGEEQNHECETEHALSSKMTPAPSREADVASADRD